jgi:thiamine biosynthesis protein ThiS
MIVLINGESRLVESAENVAAMLSELGVPVAALLVEQNGVALRTEEWLERPVSEGDRFELVRIVAGG